MHMIAKTHVNSIMRVVLYLAAITAPCLANTIRVPSDYPTVQAGIDAASPGDTVLIACGIYDEHDISIATSGICVTSENQTPECVVIDAQGAGRVFYLAGVDRTTSLVGLTITGGFASDGGGIYCFEASPTLLACNIDGNACTTSGGGVHCQTSSPRFTDCLFMDNSAVSITGGGGGGLSCTFYCSPQIEHCEFTGNSAGHIGGALYCAYTCNPVIRDVCFSGNTSNGSAGAAFIGDSRCNLIRCRFDQNVASGPGAGLFIQGAGGVPVLLENCSYSRNQATEGGGLFIQYSCRNVILEHCTFAENTGAPGGGISCTSNSLIRLHNTIIAFSPTGEALYVDGPDVATLTCCDLYGNAWGDWNPNIAAQYGINGNISEDPLFCGDLNPLLPYLLDGESPCALENNPECGQIGAWPVGCGAIQAIPDDSAPGGHSAWLAVAPNPFVSTTRITYALYSRFAGMPVNLAIFDCNGRRIRCLRSSDSAPGPHEVIWDGRNDAGRIVAAGHYYCKLTAMGLCETHPISLIW